MRFVVVSVMDESLFADYAQQAIMNPFWRLDMPIRSPVFRQRVAAAGKKYL